MQPALRSFGIAKGHQRARAEVVRACIIGIPPEIFFDDLDRLRSLCNGFLFAAEAAQRLYTQASRLVFGRVHFTGSFE